MILTVNTSPSYEIIFEKGGINNIDKYWGCGDKTFIITDSGVPEEYSRAVAKSCKESYIHTIPMGETSKDIKYLIEIWQKMTEFSMTRTDRIIAVGGGVAGDIAGLAAANYMRGIDFYNIPTTTLSQVDSSVGGKTAIDFMGYKNIIGAFHQPKGVIIDTLTLKTLPRRHIANGLAEAIKMAATHDEELFVRFENADFEDMDEIEILLRDAVNIKRMVVERDEKETGERKALNFGHTLGHALESSLEFNELYHGECVSLGMRAMCSREVSDRLGNLFRKINMPEVFPSEISSLAEKCRHDKKAGNDKITIVYVEKIGSYELRELSFDEFNEYIGKVKI